MYSPPKAESYLLFLLFFVWDNAEPATDLALSLYRPSFNISEAVDATFLLVCFLFMV